MAAALPAETIDEITEYVRREVAAGYVRHDEIASNAAEMFADEHDEAAVEACAEQVIPQTLAAQRTAESTWPAVTDYNRLSGAFAELEAAGIVCRENFSCCGNCGTAEIWTELDGERELGREVIGYAFFHMQDTESAVEGHGLFLNYGSVLKGDRPAVEVGQMIAIALRNAGLNVTWDGTIEKRIGVMLDWKRRLAR